MYSEFRQENQNQTKVSFEQYLDGPSDPRDESSSDTPPELEAELLENRLGLKKHFRRIAQRLRNQ